MGTGSSGRRDNGLRSTTCLWPPAPRRTGRWPCWGQTLRGRPLRARLWVLARKPGGKSRWRTGWTSGRLCSRRPCPGLNVWGPRKVTAPQCDHLDAGPREVTRLMEVTRVRPWPPRPGVLTRRDVRLLPGCRVRAQGGGASADRGGASPGMERGALTAACCPGGPGSHPSSLSRCGTRGWGQSTNRRVHRVQRPTLARW